MAVCEGYLTRADRVTYRAALGEPNKRCEGSLTGPVRQAYRGALGEPNKDTESPDAS